MCFSEKSSNFANVIEMERHIEILLLNNDCVVIPGLGGFVAHHVDARYDEQDGTFLPPLRTLGFNPLLTMNDSLLAQSYVEAYDISYPEALRRIEKDAVKLQKELEEHGEYELYNIGRLTVNEHGKTEFSPCEAGILTPELYGLSSFELSPIHNMQQTTSTTQHTTLNVQHPAKKARIISINTDKETGQKMVSISMKALRNVAVAAVLIAAFFMIASPLSNNTKVFSPEKIKSGILYDIFSSEKKAENKAAKLESGNDTKGIATPQTPDATSQPSQNQKLWSIVLCSHVSKSNAGIFISQLAAEGIQGRLVISNKGVVKVLYGNFSSEAEAQQALKDMRTINKRFAQGWITLAE